MSPDPQLPTDYYLRNFELLVTTVLRRHHPLLRAEEIQFAESFLSQGDDARKLLVRLLCRRGPWFRSAELRYGEIVDIPRAIHALIEAELVVDASAAELADLLELLRKDEILALARSFDRVIPSARRRDEALADLVAAVDATRLFERVAAATQAIAPLGSEHLAVFLFLFFGNFEQDFSDFVLRDLGRARYEHYSIDETFPLFSNRADVDFLFGTAELGAEAEEAATEGDEPTLMMCVERALALSPRPGVRLQRRYGRLLNNLGHMLEQRDNLAVALRCYAQSPLPPARERTCRIQAKQGDLEGALRLAIAIADAPLDAGEESFAASFLRRHAKRSSIAAEWVAHHPKDEAVPSHEFLLNKSDIPVEEAVLIHTTSLGWHGAFVENALWCSLFGLLCWEQLFAPVPGVFQHEFQSAPMDIASPDFYATRAGSFDNHFDWLASRTPAELTLFLLERLEAKQGLQNRFVDWSVINREILEAFASRIAPPHLVSILATIARNPLRFDSGFPDLFLWRPNSLEWALWEVKGPGDTLRPEQIFWLREFNRLGISAAVVYVRYGES
jgi:hypothetical protein